MKTKLLECNGCGCDWRERPAPMLHDYVWRTIARHNEILCLECAEAKLGRSIELDDMYNCLFNEIFAFVWESLYVEFDDQGNMLHPGEMQRQHKLRMREHKQRQLTLQKQRRNAVRTRKG